MPVTDISTENPRDERELGVGSYAAAPVELAAEAVPQYRGVSGSLLEAD